MRLCGFILVPSHTSGGKALVDSPAEEELARGPNTTAQEGPDTGSTILTSLRVTPVRFRTKISDEDGMTDSSRVPGVRDAENWCNKPQSRPFSC